MPVGTAVATALDPGLAGRRLTRHRSVTGISRRGVKPVAGEGDGPRGGHHALIEDAVTRTQGPVHRGKVHTACATAAHRAASLGVGPSDAGLTQAGWVRRRCRMNERPQLRWVFGACWVSTRWERAYVGGDCRNAKRHDAGVIEGLLDVANATGDMRGDQADCRSGWHQLQMAPWPDAHGCGQARALA